MGSKEERLEKLRVFISKCMACPLFRTRKNAVFGEGNIDARIMFIGEGPGQEEDETGRPFVGRSGKLLRDLIRAIGLDPEKDCYIANVVKDRPPGNRVPEQAEIDICVKYLKKQVEIISPRMIVLLGRTAVRGLLDTDTSIDVLRDSSKKKALSYQGVLVMVTYHPSALLRDPSKKPKVAEDFRFLQGLITSLYEKDGHGPVDGNVSPEQLSIPERIGVHGKESGNTESASMRLPSLFSED